MTKYAHCWLPLLVALLACEQAHRNPCGQGFKPSAAEDRCVNALDAAVGAASGTDDAGQDAKPGPDAMKDASVPDMTFVDAGEDAGPQDGGETASGTADAGHDAGDVVVAPACLEPDIQAWETFHLSNQLTAQINACTTMLACTPGSPCALDRCLRDAAAVKSCDACTSDEVTCVANNCQKPCATSDEECRACACAAGCIAQFETCAGRGINVCSACEANAGQCGGEELPVELIMVVVNPLIL